MGRRTDTDVRKTSQIILIKIYNLKKNHEGLYKENQGTRHLLNFIIIQYDFPFNLLSMMIF